ncbi:hypothetical protein [Methanobrevibacter sp.]
MKKIITVTALLIAVCLFAGIVCASPNVLTPEGYTVNQNYTQVDKETTILGVPAVATSVVMENGTDNITVTTFVPSKEIDLSPAGASVYKNISSKEGIFEEKNGRFIFSYVEEGELIQIDSPAEKLIEKVIG